MAGLKVRVTIEGQTRIVSVWTSWRMDIITAMHKGWEWDFEFLPC